MTSRTLTGLPKVRKAVIGLSLVLASALALVGDTKTSTALSMILAPLRAGGLTLKSSQLPPSVGGLDPSFDGDGKLTTDFSGFIDEATDIAIQNDGKIIVVGYTNETQAFTSGFAVVRYNQDGSLDTSFGNGGKVTTKFPPRNSDDYTVDYARAVAVQPDGKLIVVGSSNNQMVAVRYNPNGTIDTLFGDEFTTYQIAPGVGVNGKLGLMQDAAAFAVAVQNDGRILVGGAGSDGSFGEAEKFLLVRLNPNGSYDRTFGEESFFLNSNTGWVYLDIDEGEESKIKDIAIQKDGKIVVTGPAGTLRRSAFAFARFNTDGSPDASFRGLLFFSGTSSDSAESVMIQHDGKIVIAGTSQEGWFGYFALARFNSDGSLDNSFGNAGKVITGFDNQTAAVTASEYDGKIILAGHVTSDFLNYDFTLVRYNDDGTLDNSFGSGGKVTTDFLGNSSDQANAVSIQTDGKILAAGSTSNGYSDFALARFLGGPDPAISINSVAITEGNDGIRELEFTVKLSESSPQTVTVDYFTSDGTATADTDYTAIPTGTLIFDPGGTIGTVFVRVNGDTDVESYETVHLHLSNPTNATISDNQGTGTIGNDDFPSISVNDASVQEPYFVGHFWNLDFRISLSQPAVETVTVDYWTSDGSAINVFERDYERILPTTLTFNEGETSKIVSVVIRGDEDIEPNETFNLNLSNATKATIADNLGVGTIINDDGPEVSRPTISIIADQTTAEDSATGAIPFTINDGQTPPANLTLSVTSPNTAIVPISNIVFGGSGANRTVTITPAPNQNGEVWVDLTVTDENGLRSTEGFLLRVNPINDPPTISNILSRTVNANTSTGAVPFWIDDVETSANNLSLTRASSNTTLVPVNNIVFGGSGANRTVSVTLAANQSGTATITVTVTDAAGASASDTFVLTVFSAEAPTISDIANRTIIEGENTGPIAFTIGDGLTPPGSLTVSGLSSNETLVPRGNIVFGGSGANRLVAIAPVANQHGTATIAVTVTDPDGLTASDTFVLTVNAVNDPPTISDISNQTINANGSLDSVPFTIGDAETPVADLRLSGISSSTALVPNSHISFTGSGTNRKVTVTPTPNQSGAATITVTVTDSTGAAATDTFVLTVNAVDDPPTISDISDQTTNEDTPTGAIAFVLSDPDTPADTLTVSGSSSNEPLVPPGNIAFGGTEGSRTVTVTPAPNQFGTATITVAVTDPGGLTSSDTFSLTVNSVNDAPAISNINNQSINPNSATDALQFTISDIETAAANLVVVGNSSNTTLVPNANITFGGSGENRTVTVTPAANQTGSALITVTVTDANGGTAVEPFSLTVSGLSFETLHHISFGTPVIQIAGFGFDPQNRPAAGWGESSSNGGVNNFRWARRVNDVWSVNTLDQPGGGIRAAQADFILREDGTPFFAYAIRDAWIFGQDWYTAHIVDLDLFPTGHGSSVQPIESGQSCFSAYPKFAMDFAPNASAPSFLLGTHCSYGGWLSLDNATIHGEPPFRATAGTGGEFHSLDYARGPGGSHHVTYYSERGGPNWGAYYSNGSPGHELLLVKPHRNRAAETSVAVGADGRIHVAIGGVPLCDNTFEGGLLYLTSTDGVNWTRMFVDDVSGRSPSITLDAAGKPHIAYWRQNAEVRLASLEADAWTTRPIYTATTPVTRASVKLGFDADNQPHVLFFNPDASDIQMSSGVSSNIAPAVTNPGSMVSEISQNISLQIAASDAENSALVYRACNLPAGLSINPNTGLISGTITGSPANHAVTITVADAAGNTGSVSFSWVTIPAGAAYQLAFLVQPTNTNTPNAISPAVQVAVQDLFGNTLNNAVDSVTIALANNPGGSTLSGGLTRNAVNGVATFDDLRLEQAGTGYTLRATSGNLISVTSNAFNIFHPAVIEVTEQILVTDTPSLLPSAVINVSENIVVQDAPALLPAAMLNIIEQINVLDTPAFWPPVATPTGANVSVQVENVTITFNNVSTAGFTSIVPIDPASAGTLPAGFTLCAGCPAYEITTTAVYTPPVTIAMNVPSVNDQVVFSQLKMLHGEDGVLVDRTTGHNFNDKYVFGSVNSLSPFVIVQNASIPSPTPTSTPTPTPTPTVNAGQVIISEFRLRGPGNNGVATGISQKALLSKAASIVSESTSVANDEFVEIYNATDSDITVSTTDGSAGWALAASDGVARFVVPNGTVISARGHFLGVNSAGYSLSASASGDIEYTTDIPDNAGIALFRSANTANFTLDDRLDAVGSTSEANALYREGAGYPAFISADLALNLEHSFYRSLCSFQWGVGCATPGNPRDTNENAVDFLFVDTNGALTAAGQRLGAPGPENLASPIRRDAAMPFVLLDASVQASAPPNRLRDSTSDPANASTFGTLAVPRRITNNTGGPVTRLQFRIVELTTWPAPNGVADLRARSSGASFTISGINDANTCAATGTPITTPCMVTVQATTLTQPPNQPGNVGGGQNAVLAVGTITMSEPLQNGQSINVQFLLGVQRTGLFRFLIIIEALP